MDNKSIAINLANCETEKEVVSFLKKEGLWDDPSRWRDFGDNENNWSTIGNQQSAADAALVEKIVNSVDALLMKECMVRGISPESEEAPRSISEALEQFFNISGGKIQNLTEKERTELAQKNIILAATGSKTNPNYVIVDQGEGQTPKEMPNTILSINKSNKLKVPFVQGKFNMGGTGVLDFCGEEKLQLIISKRCPDIAEDDSTHDFWGFTIIRRERPFAGSGRKSSKYTYLVNNDREIMSFNSVNMPIIPSSSGKKGNMDYGMYCKLYNYNLTGMKSDINYRFNDRMSLLLPNLAYPVYLDECRPYQGHTHHRTLSGLNVRLNDWMGKEDNQIEEKITAKFTIDGQKIDVITYAFDTKENLDRYRKNEGVLMVQDGQTQATEPVRFYRNQAVGLSYLADCLLTIVDCSEIDENTREELFMNSRDRLRSSDFTNKLKSELQTFLKENKTLKQLQAQRRENLIKDKLDDKKPLEDALSSVLNNSPVLSSLFLSGERLKNPVNLEPKTKAETFEGKYSPTYFTLIESKSNSTPIYCREVQLGRKFRIRFRTDVCNDFFTRDKYPGQFTLERGEAIIEDYFINLHNGTATLNVDLPESAKVGDEYSYSYNVMDTSSEKDFSGEFQIFVAEKQDTPGTNGRRTPPSSKEKGHDALNPVGIELPKVMEVTRDDWDTYNFDKESALAAYNNEDKPYDFFVNMDNIHLLTELKNVSKDEARMKLLKARYKYGMVLVGLSVLGYEKTHQDPEDATKSEIEDPEDTIRLVTRMISPVILPMIDSFGDALSDSLV